MSPSSIASTAVFAAYLIGSVPFAYLVAWWAKGIDIRTVGSGNVGATNIGRVLGFRYFLLVFALDLLKGLATTLALPRIGARVVGHDVPALEVMVALAVIVGHNFPLFLKFQGGKGVATSLGALLALDPWASLATVAVFVACLIATRYVSLSSLIGGIAFVVAHFVRVRRPWAPDQLAMSLLTIGLLGMLIVRHRKNLARIAAGTEPKVSLGKKRTPPSGRVGLIVVIALGLLGSGTVLAYRAAQPATLDCGAFRLVAQGRIDTGHQRAERLTFADQGRLLAVICPRYNRVPLYRITSERPPTLFREIELTARPVALWPTADRLYVLQRPVADARHVEPAYWETFDFRGNPIGSRFLVGYDPDDMVVTDDGRTALVVVSGRAEGETNRPAPSLIVVDVADGRTPRIRGRLTFDHPRDDPFRVAFRFEAGQAAVSLLGSNEIAWIDLADLDHPRLVGRTPWPGSPGALSFDDRGRLMVAEADGGAVRTLAFGGGTQGTLPFTAPVGEFARMVQSSGRSWTLGVNPKDSSLEVVDPSGARSLGRLALHGSANLGRVRPMGVAVSGWRAAVADRTGGIHIIKLENSYALPN